MKLYVFPFMKMNKMFGGINDMKTKNYLIKSKITKAIVRDLEIEFDEQIAIDPETEEEIYIRELEIENDIRLYDMYKKEKGLLQSHEVKKIRDKYNINQKDFSKILGLGEITIHRYENGTIQTNANDSIIRFSEDPYSMDKFAYKNKCKISEDIFENLIKRIKELKLYAKHEIADIDKEVLLKLEFQTEYVERIAEKTIELYNKRTIKQSEEYNTDIPKITNLELQKLLYYIQAICLTVYKKVAFRERIYAWDYGPIIYEIYSKYKQYKDNEINVISKNKLSPGLEKIINIVLDGYGKFNGGQLINLTHEEEPWLKTYKDDIINPQIIQEYFEKVYET